MRNKKFRITDFFRRQDKQGYGTLMRQEFVEGMLASSTLKRLHVSSPSHTTNGEFAAQLSCFEEKKIKILDTLLYLQKQHVVQMNFRDF